MFDVWPVKEEPIAAILRAQASAARGGYSNPICIASWTPNVTVCPNKDPKR
jgi:hypothetical protein